MEAFAASGNATGAARAAGYRHPEQQGCRLLRNVQVARALRDLADRERSAAVIDREQRQAWWSAIVRGEVAGPDGEPPSIAERLRASELLGKAQGDFLERREETHHVGGRLKIVQVPPKEEAQSVQVKGLDQKSGSDE